MPPSELAQHELLIWQRDNEYIRSGYRPLSSSFTYRYKSLYLYRSSKALYFSAAKQVYKQQVNSSYRHSYIYPTSIISQYLFPAGGYVSYLVLNKPKQRLILPKPTLYLIIFPLYKLKGCLRILIAISLRSAITQGAQVKAFSLVGGGVKGAPMKLKGNVIC